MCHPILAGGLMWLSDACYVAAVVNAGGMAFITARSFETEADFAAELELCSRLAGGKPFGVNLSLSRRADANMAAYRQLGLALDAGVRHFETAGPSPKPLFEAIHAAGGIVIHKCAYLAHALKAEEQGADAITLVDPAGNHKLAKARSLGRIDAAAATVLAVAEGMRRKAAPMRKARVAWL